MFQLSFIKNRREVSVRSEKHLSLKRFKTDLGQSYNIYDFKLAMKEILGEGLRKELDDKYQELEDRDEALTLANKYDKALELGLFDDFEDVINKIYEENRRK